MALKIYYDLQNQKLVPGTNSTAEITAMEFMLRDTIPIEVYILAEQSSVNVPYAVTELDSGQTLMFGGKEDEDDAEFLYSVSSWTKSGSGTTAKYSGTLSLNTAALITAIGTADTLTTKAEFTVIGTSNENMYSTKFTLTVNKDVISGSEGVPVSTYTVIAQYADDNNVQAVRIVNADGVCMSIFKNGAPYVFIQSTGLWYPLTATIVDGIPVPAFGAGESI